MKTAISVSKEDYLKAILEAESEGRSVIAATLAHWLGVSAPAVSMALRRLRRDGYVRVEDDGILRLTDEGREAAWRTALRHHLIERMLSEVFGMPWYQVHDEAERLEHAVSPAFEALLLRKLGDQGTCPHGNAVLPESEESRRRRGVRPLADVADGEPLRVASLYERDPELLRYLHRTGIEPGGPVRVLSRNSDQTLTIETSTGQFTIDPAAANKVQVSVQVSPAAGEGQSPRADGSKSRQSAQHGKNRGHATEAAR